MKSKYCTNGFTLIEILIAMAIIVVIITMLYSSYFVMSKSAQVYKTRIALFQQGRKVVGQMSRQIRCTYDGISETTVPSATLTSISGQINEMPENVISYFDGNQDSPDGEILHLVTMSSFFSNPDLTNGPFEVAYKFDKIKGVLFLSQQRFANIAGDVMRTRNWQPIINNIRFLELAFFDGHQWLKKWNLSEKIKLPSAVRIDITCEDENYRMYHYSTTVNVYCWKNQDENTQTKRLVAIKNNETKEN